MHAQFAEGLHFSAFHYKTFYTPLERDRDYRQIFPMVVFSGELIKPVMVTIIEDETVEELNEDFTVTVARSVGQPANVIPVNIPARITIRDDDSIIIN